MTVWEQLQACPRDNVYAHAPLDMDGLLRLMHQIRREREITATEVMMRNSTSPPCPIEAFIQSDPGDPDPEYQCVMIGPSPEHTLHAETYEGWGNPYEPKDLAAVRKIIKNWENPEEVNVRQYLEVRRPNTGMGGRALAPPNARRSLSPARNSSNQDD